MNKAKQAQSVQLSPDHGALLDRVVSILEQAQSNVVRAVNTHMVLAYWLIGREIVQALQGGQERAAYGQQVLQDLSTQLALRYGGGFSVPNLQNFRKFYLAYSTRISAPTAIQYLPGTESKKVSTQYPLGTELQATVSPAFSPQLSWSHYRALMRVDNTQARDFYEREAAECGWSKLQLERQIHSFYFERIVSHHGEQGLLTDGRERLAGEATRPAQVLKSPMVVEFLGLPDFHVLHDSKLEQAIIDNLQGFLLELGKGFSFVARQKRLRFGDEDYFVDLVFYNYVLKCFLLIDLKMGKLTHADVGQMDGYVRLYEDQFKIAGDNPTIGLLLCSDKSEAVAKYSILSESKQIFASKYLPNLPTEEQLRREIERERLMIEAALKDRAGE